MKENAPGKQQFFTVTAFADDPNSILDNGSITGLEALISYARALPETVH
jgi:hypothetical protein